MYSIRCLLLPTFRSLAAKYCVNYVSENINFPMKICGIVSFFFPQNTHCGHLNETPNIEVVLNSTNNLCFNGANDQLPKPSTFS